MVASALVLPRYCCTLYHKENKENSAAKFVFLRVRVSNVLTSPPLSVSFPSLYVHKTLTFTSAEINLACENSPLSSPLAARDVFGERGGTAVFTG